LGRPKLRDSLQKINFIGMSLKKIASLALPIALGLIGACTPPAPKDFTHLSDEELREKAVELAHKYIITDGHVDLPYRMKVKNFRLEKEWIDISDRTEEGEFDYARAKEGGLDAPFMSIYIPAAYQSTPGKSKEFADSLIHLIEGIVRLHPTKFALANSPADVEANFAKGLISLPMGMENGAPIEDDIANVAYFHKRGIRYITLTHSKDNQICDSSYDTSYTWNGLSPFGEQVVSEMNRVGIMVDVSHISDSAFYDVMRLTKAPVIASHSSCRTFTPGFERNMSDEMIVRLAENGGVIQINFGSTFLDGEVAKTNDLNRTKLREILNEAGLSTRDEAAKPLIEQFRNDNPSLFADVETVAKHIDHVVKLVGIDHVGFGSDYDGVGDTLPTGLKDVSQYPNLIYLLLKRGYTEEDIAKICYQNVWRVWNEVERVAAEWQK
jgi:membrane dipeptidase